MTSPTPLVRTEHYDRIAIVILSRPEKRNAMTPAMLDDLCTALSEAATKARAIVLGGEGSTKRWMRERE